MSSDLYEHHHHEQYQAICINKGSKTDLPVELIFEEAFPESIFIHDAWHIGHESPVHMGLLSKDLLHTLWRHLVPHLSQHNNHYDHFSQASGHSVTQLGAYRCNELPLNLSS